MKAKVVLARLPGLIPYEVGSLLQKAMVSRRRAGVAPDTLLLLEHPPVFTLGRLQESASNLKRSHDEIASAGASVIQSDRGGNVTFHGPGQLVAYPILDLSNYKRNMRWYVGALEEAMIGAAAAFGVEAKPGGSGQTGVWVGERKIGAIGVSVSRWFTHHGVALNCDVDLDYFKMIVPCGLADTPEVTSLSRELGRRVSVDEVAPKFCEAFAQALDADLVTENDGSVEAQLREARAAVALAAAKKGG